MNFRETTQEDIVYMADHSVSRGIFKKQPERTEYLYTLEHEGVPLGVGGFTLVNLTTAWCWVDIGTEAGNHVVVFYRLIKEWMETFVKDHNLKRLQAYVEMDFPEAIRMVRHLGFHEESIMQDFIEDRDAFLYVRIF